MRRTIDKEPTMEENQRREPQSQRIRNSLVMILLVIEVYNITHSKIFEFITIGVATLTLSTGVCAYSWARTLLELREILEAPVLKIGPHLKKIILGEAAKIVPYARVEGQVKAIHRPIQSMYIDGVTGVMQKLVCREYSSKWNYTKTQWYDADRTTQKATKTVPFLLTSGDSSVKVEDPHKASGIEMATFYDKFHPTSVSWFQSILNWFSGEKTKGFQNIELMLPQGKTLTGIGELSISNNNVVVLGPPSRGKIYVLATSYANLDFANALKSRVKKWKWLSMISCTFGGISVFGYLLMGYKLRFVVYGIFALTLPLVCIKLWFDYKTKRRKALMQVFARRVKDIEDHESENEGNTSTSSSEEAHEDEPGDDDDDVNTCVVCMSEPRDCVLVDCGHICVCSTCAEELDPYQCPICRKRIVQVLPIYHA